MRSVIAVMTSILIFAMKGDPGHSNATTKSCENRWGWLAKIHDWPCIVCHWS